MKNTVLFFSPNLTGEYIDGHDWESRPVIFTGKYKNFFACLDRCGIFIMS